MQRRRGVWKARLICAMADAPGRFNALARTTDIPPHHLCGVLRRYIKRGILIKHERGPRDTDYRLTDAGRALIEESREILAEEAARAA